MKFFYLNLIFLSVVTSKSFNYIFNDVIKVLYVEEKIPFDIIMFKSPKADIVDIIGKHSSGRVVKTSGIL